MRCEASDAFGQHGGSSDDGAMPEVWRVPGRRRPIL